MRLLLPLILGLTMMSLSISEELNSDGANDIYSSIDELPLDDAKRLIDHHLLYVDLPHCYNAYSEERFQFDHRLNL
jgi:hypothetical protein